LHAKNYKDNEKGAIFYKRGGAYALLAPFFSEQLEDKPNCL
jgi:hypothetical protein